MFMFMCVCVCVYTKRCVCVNGQVLAARAARYAITTWYYNADERRSALQTAGTFLSLFACFFDLLIYACISFYLESVFARVFWKRGTVGLAGCERGRLGCL